MSNTTTVPNTATFDIHSLYLHGSIQKARSYLHRTTSGSLPSSSSTITSTSTTSSKLSPAILLELNRRDTNSRTLLHSVSSDPSPVALQWLELLLSISGCAVNLQDGESGWTALHRALYAGNLVGARLLLARSDVEVGIKDAEGLTAFDLYNSTVESTNPSLPPLPSSSPSSSSEDLSPLHTQTTLPNEGRQELYTWGSNRNFVLGFPGDNDRIFAEKVPLARVLPGARFMVDKGKGKEREIGSEEGGAGGGVKAFDPVRVREISMGRLHTGLITDEKGVGNVRLCGYGTGGRLGESTHTQFTFTPLSSFPHQVASIALSPDHTVLLTTKGDVYTFGTNRFSQLGYIVDSPTASSSSSTSTTSHSASSKPYSKEESINLIQATPKRVVGLLKKEHLEGIATSRTHTVAYTSTSLYTWGTSRGQLGYSLPSSSGQVQVLPRKVTIVPEGIGSVKATENATAVLLLSGEVWVLWREGFVKIVWPVKRGLGGGRGMVYRPPQVVERGRVVKIESCGNCFAAVSDLGDVFTFVMESASTITSAAGTNSMNGNGNGNGNGYSFDQPSTTTTSSMNGKLAQPKVTRVWSLRKQHMAITDVGVGADGSLIMCTRSGHVYLRTKKFEVLSAGGKFSTSTTMAGNATPPTSSTISNSNGNNYKVTRVPYLQRVVKVAANSTGGYAALRSDVALRFIEIEGKKVREDLEGMLVHWLRISELEGGWKKKNLKKQQNSNRSEEEEEEEGDEMVERDEEIARWLLRGIDLWDEGWEVPAAGSDGFVTFRGGKGKIPVHFTLLASRSTVFLQEIEESENPIITSLGSNSDLTVFLFLHYLYTDDLPAIWDARIGTKLREVVPKHQLLKVDFGKVKAELQLLAKRYGLEELSQSLVFNGKNTPFPSLERDLERLLPRNLDSISTTSSTSILPRPDLLITLAEGIEISCHSFLLRARCPFFSTFFGDEDWVKERREPGLGLVRFDLGHVKGEVMGLVLEHLYCDSGVEMFDKIDRPTADDYIDFVTQVLAVANELLIDKLKLVCSAVLRGFITLNNVCSILVDATFYEADDLTRACLYYIASSMETILEARLLDDLPPALLTVVSHFVQERQGAKMPITRSGILVSELLVKHAGWLSDLDVGKPTGGYRKFRAIIPPKSPGPSPSFLLLSPGPSPQLHPRKSPLMRPTKSPAGSPALKPLREIEEPFAMDEDFSLDVAPRRNTSVSNLAPGGGSSKNSYVNSSPLLAATSPPSKSQWNSIAPDLARAPLDLRSIMAKEQKTERRSVSEGDRTRTASVSKGSPSLSASSSPWRPSTPSWQPAGTTRTSLADIQSQQSAFVAPSLPAPIATRQPIRNHSSSSPISASPSASSFVRPSSSSSAHGAGVITPSRMPSTANRTPSGSRPSAKSGYRAADVPWTNYTVAPAPPPLDDPFEFFSTSPPAASASFASIQSQQKAEVEAIKETKAPRSFAEVMAQEALDALNRAEEIEFEKWWEAESKKMAAGDATSFAQSVATPESNGRGRGRGGSSKKAGGSRKKVNVEAIVGVNPGEASSSGRGGSAGGGNRGRGRGGRGRGAVVIS